MLLSDLLQTIMASPFGGFAGGPAIRGLPKAPSNVSAPGVLSALNTASSPADFMNATAQAAEAPILNQLRQQQVGLTKAQLDMLRYKLGLMPEVMKAAQGLTASMTGNAPQAAGTQTASRGPEAAPSSPSADASLDLIAKDESGGRNIHQQVVGPNGGYNPSTGTVTGPSSASGPWQITDTTWRETAPEVGVDIAKFPTAMSAPVDVQRTVAKHLLETRGYAPWAPYNPKLRADLAAAPNASPASTTAAAPSPAIPPGTTPQDALNARLKAQTGQPMTPQEQVLSRINPAAILNFGLVSRMAGMGDLAQPFEQFYYNSPQFKAAQAAAQMAATKPIELQYAGPMAAAAARAKMLNTPINIRQGGSAWIVNPDGTARLLAQSPKLPEGYQLGPNGEAVAVPGAISGIQTSSTAKAAGPAAFEPQAFHGPYGQTFQGTRLQLGQNPAVGAPVASTESPGAPVAAGMPTASAQRPEAAAPTFPVQTPAGAKDISQVTIADMFPNGQGIPQPPAPPAGMGYGKPDQATEKMQEDDATRLEGYNKEASENQKIYQDLAHLHDVLGQSLNTNKLAPLWTDLTNVAHGLGSDNLIPKSYDPSNAAEFDKAATDLVFAAVKKLAGQVRVAEIEGYKRANPSIVIPRETNYNIVNDVLATSKWQDARARLANAYWTETGHAPLGAFDARFNQMAPLVDVTAAYKQAIRSVDPNARFPGEGTNATAAAPPTALPAGIPAGSKMIGTMGGKPVYQAPNGSHYQVQ